MSVYAVLKYRPEESNKNNFVLSELVDTFATSDIIDNVTNIVNRCYGSNTDYKDITADKDYYFESKEPEDIILEVAKEHFNPCDIFSKHNIITDYIIIRKLEIQTLD